jgi:hypothetical protein
MVNSMTLTKPDEKKFFDQLIKILYSAFKRRFRFNYVTEKVKAKLIEKNSQ